MMHTYSNNGTTTLKSSRTAPSWTSHGLIVFVESESIFIILVAVQFNRLVANT